MAKCRASEPKIFARCARKAQKVEIAVLGVKMVQLLAARPLETLGLKRRHKTRAATAGQPGPQPGNSASNRTSKQSYRLHLRLMPSTWGRGELSPFLRSLRWRSLHRHVPACRFLILSGLEATITSYQHVLGSTNLRRGRRYCRNPHHECSCSCSRVPHATCPLHMSLHVSH